MPTATSSACFKPFTDRLELLNRNTVQGTSPPSARTLAEWLAHTERLHEQTIDMGLTRVAAVRDAMGLHPRFPIFTVAGTNGKGSTCALLAACLSAAGYRVGVYSSPHLVRYNERVRIGDAFASDACLCDAFSKVEAARGTQSLTPFEFGTLAAMQVFVEEALDAVILEVGLGGRLDAVNIFDAHCAIVTSIAIDHEAYLGHTREAIGYEKAGVFRAQVPAICADLDPPISIASSAHERNAQLMQIGRDFSCGGSADDWWFSFGDTHYTHLPALKLSGEFQHRNASAALAALITLRERLPVSEEALRQGLQAARLPGRFQMLSGKPLIILDVAHNPHAATELAHNLQVLPCNGKTFAVLGMLRDKDIAGVVAIMNPLVDSWHVAGIEERRGATLAEMMQALSAVRGNKLGYESALTAFLGVLEAAQPEDRIVVFGSFVTVGQILAHLESLNA